jgi:signal transduction histidine kinase
MFDLLLLDLKLPDIDGKDLIAEFAELRRSIPFVVITGQGDERVAVEMMKRGALDYVVKDIRFQEFLPAIVERALTQIDRDAKLARAEADLHRAHRDLENRIEERTADLGRANAELKNEINERKRAEKALRRAHADLEKRVCQRTAELADANATLQEDIAERKRLETEILEISAREQRRIGQDLHDGLGQHLAGIELMSQVLEQKLVKISKPASTQAAKISEYVRDAIAQARLLARGLSPVVLESQGLMFALEELCSKTERLFNVRCRFQCEIPVLFDDNDVATHLYRIAQEAVTNSVKHGKAKRIEIRLHNSRETTCLSIKDNGRGFPSEATDAGGMGLRIMQYRASMIGGTIALQTDPKQGTTITCTTKLRSAAHAPMPR